MMFLVSFVTICYATTEQHFKMQEENIDKDFSKLFHSIIDSGAWAKWSFKAKAVYVVLNRFANYDSRKALPTVVTVARLAGLSEDGARAGIKEIEASGYLDKKRGGPKIGFRNMYTIHKEQQLRSSKLVADILRGKTVKCKAKRDANTGKFMPSREKTVDYPREKTMTDTSRENHGKKEILETLTNRDITAGSALVCLSSQASPASSRIKRSLSQVTNETLFCLKDTFGGSQGLKDYLTKTGYPKEEIEGLNL